MRRVRCPVEEKRPIRFRAFGQKFDGLVAQDPGVVGLVRLQVDPEALVKPGVTVIHLCLVKDHSD